MSLGALTDLYVKGWVRGGWRGPKLDELASSLVDLTLEDDYGDARDLLGDAVVDEHVYARHEL